MKTKIILYSMLITMVAIMAITSCSSNIDPILKPTANNRTITLEADGKTVSDNGTDLSISINLDAGSKDIPVEVKSNTLWKVAVSGNSGWCTVSIAEGKGNGSFIITVLSNRSEDRNCTISVYQVDSAGEAYKDNNTARIDINQIGSEVYITPSSLDIFPADAPQEKEFDIVANVNWTLSVRYENESTDEFISIFPVNGMSESETPYGKKEYTGNSDAAFKISLQDNRNPVVRKAYLELKTESGNYSVEISQQKSDHPFDVSHSETRYVAAEGNSLDFDVYSPGDGWQVTAESWIICPDTRFEKSDKWVSVSVTVMPNTTGRERIGKIYFKSGNTGYEAVSVEVVQSGYDLTFDISSPDGSSVVMKEGGHLSFDLDSRFDWTIETPSWVKSSTYAGKASVSSIEIGLEVEDNLTNNNRTGTVTVYPQPTEVAGGALLNPSELGIGSLKFSVTQFGGREAAISVPWLLDGYTQTFATIEFNYYSPFANVTDTGLQWKKEDASEWSTVTANVNDPKEGTVTVDLDSLDPATKYVARGYVKDDTGKTIYGSVSYPFTTAGKFPGSNDNPTPTR